MMTPEQSAAHAARIEIIQKLGYGPSSMAGPDWIVSKVKAERAERDALKVQLHNLEEAVWALLKAPHNSFSDALWREKVKELLAYSGPVKTVCEAKYHLMTCDRLAGHPGMHEHHTEKGMECAW